MCSRTLYVLQNALPPRFSPNARWAGNVVVLNPIAQFETTNGALKFPEIGSGTLLRRPVDELSNMSADMATLNSKFLLYGDFASFVIADRIGSVVEMIDNVVGVDGRPTGHRGVMLWFRTGSDVTVDNGFRVLNKTV